MSDSEDSLLESEIFSNYKPRSCLVTNTNDSDTDSDMDLLFEAEKREYRWADRHLLDILENQLDEDEHQRLFRMLPETLEDLFNECWYKFEKLGLSSNGYSISIRKA